MFVVVPDSHAFALQLLDMPDTCFPVSLINESSLFDGIVYKSWNKYALQMAIKLIVACHVMTTFYITLDADVILVGSLDATYLLPSGKAMLAAVITFRH